MISHPIYFKCITLITSGTWHTRFGGLDFRTLKTDPRVFGCIDLWSIWRKTCVGIDVNQGERFKINNLNSPPGSDHRAPFFLYNCPSVPRSGPDSQLESEHRPSYVRRNGKEPLCQTDYQISNKIATQPLDPGTSQHKCWRSSLPGLAGDMGVIATCQPPWNSTLMM